MPYGGKLLKALNEHGPRLHHVAFQVLDILEECDKAMNDGFILLRSKPVIGVGGMLINFILPERRGVLVELVQCQR
jgi:methylmalonyl-CoA/ethylmalonyl-CoA epimerase